MSAKRVGQDRTRAAVFAHLSRIDKSQVLTLSLPSKPGFACFEKGRSVRIDQSDRGTALAPNLLYTEPRIAEKYRCATASVLNPLESVGDKAQGYSLQRRTCDDPNK